jgi:hypothetical protein
VRACNYFGSGSRLFLETAAIRSSTANEFRSE